MNIYRLTVFSAGMAALFLGGTAAKAEVDYFSLSAEELLKASIVTATKTKETVAEIPAAVYVITQEDIAHSGMTSVPELLRLAPGVNVARTSSNTWAISIRGFNKTLTNKILVMIDGRSVYDPLFAGTFWEIQDLPLQDIERIEVVRGPGGALWGANAVNGVINIITKSAKDTRGNLVNAGAGNYEQAFATARHGGAIGSDGRSFYRVYAKYNDRRDFNSLGGHETNDGWQNYRGGFRTDWGDDNTPDHLTVHGDVYRVNAGENNTSYSLSAPFSTSAPENVFSSGGNIMENWRHGFDDGSSFKIQSYLSGVERREILFQDRRMTFDIDGQYNFRPFGRQKIIVGGNLSRIFDNASGGSLITFDPPEFAGTRASIFAQDKIALQPEHWFLTLGSKFENNYYTGMETSPDARLEWLPDRSQAVWTSVSRAVRVPSRLERDVDIANLVVGPGVLGPNTTELVLTDNKNFKSETLIAYEAGYRKQVTPALSFDTSIFANNYKNLATLQAGTPFFVPAGIDPAHDVFPLQEVNQMSGEIYGAELAVSWQARPDWKLTGGYSRLDMFLHSPTAAGQNQETPEGGSPQNQFNIRSYWNINKDWTFDTSVFYVGRLPQFQTSAYTRVDANLGWRIKPGMRFNLIGENLFDRQHVEFGNTTDANVGQVPRSIFGELTCEF